MRRHHDLSSILPYHGIVRYTQKMLVSILLPRKALKVTHLVPHREEAKDGAALIDHIYMDAMGFGMGCCCLQLTFQSCNVDEARCMYDALIPVGPIMVSIIRRPMDFITHLSP
jgi:hypothetical protein